jgi:hypothetical protein
MIVTAWNNGKHLSSGAGYGIKLSIQDRDLYFDPKWNSAIVSLPDGNKVEANINKSSFWNGTCRELINKQIGQWFIGSRLAPWQKGSPPKLKLIHIAENRFKLEK